MAGKAMKAVVQMACSVMVFRAMLMVRHAEAQVNAKLSSNAIAQIHANGMPPMIWQQSTTFITVGYLR